MGTKTKITEELAKPKETETMKGTAAMKETAAASRTAPLRNQKGKTPDLP